MKVVVLGATKGMGRAISRLLTAEKHEVFLLGRDTESLKKSVKDLEIRSGADVCYEYCDLVDPASFDNALNRADDVLGGFDTMIVTAAMFDTQDELEGDEDRTGELLSINFTNTIRFCEATRKRLLARGGGTLCVFSSVAGDRGRKPVVLYGASKAGLSYYLEALDHKFHDQGLRVVCVKPGFVKTGMTQGLRPPPFAGDPVQVANIVVSAVKKGRPVVYVPRIWWLVMLVIRWMPRFAMRKIGF